MHNDITGIWKQKTEERKSQVIDKEFAGFPVKARRIPLHALLKAGALPQALVEHMLRLDNDAEYRAEVAGAKSPEHYTRTLAYQQQVVGAVIMEPRFVFNGAEPGAGEVRYSEFVQLFPEFVDAVLTWVETGCPDVPVELKGGEETTVNDLAHFPKKGGRRKRAKSGDSSKRRRA